MNVCVFCGSGTGFNPVYAETAKKLGSLLALASIRLIYGGGNIGLMGQVADSVM
jgi:predicted Rossmann-fold nucleotide-binding protein